MLTVLCALAAGVALGEPPSDYPGAFAPVTPVRAAAEIIDVRQQFVNQNLGSKGYKILEGGYSAASQRNRDRLGAGDDAPSVIYVRAFDGVFAIDPFEPIKQLVPRPVHSFAHVPGADSPDTLAIQRQIFGEFSLQTDNTLFNWKRVRATAQLFNRLESARQEWLRTNGYLGVGTVNNPRHDSRVTKTTPEPRAIFRRPADVPRTQPREEVRRDTAPDAAQAGRALASTGEPMRISRPGFDLSVARVSTRGVGGDTVASR